MVDDSMQSGKNYMKTNLLSMPPMFCLQGEHRKHQVTILFCE